MPRPLKPNRCIFLRFYLAFIFYLPAMLSSIYRVHEENLPCLLCSIRSSSVI